mmetsp:Transcript_13559/g.41182  ORF Transcript_13559/g.41182 Transcript_13559/m.41182 type:complete len:261 (-) Transcript_13559:2055-2837(-)
MASTPSAGTSFARLHCSSGFPTPLTPSGSAPKVHSGSHGSRSSWRPQAAAFHLCQRHRRPRHRLAARSRWRMRRVRQRIRTRAICSASPSCSPPTSTWTASTCPLSCSLYPPPSSSLCCCYCQGWMLRCERGMDTARPQHWQAGPNRPLRSQSGPRAWPRARCLWACSHSSRVVAETLHALLACSSSWAPWSAETTFWAPQPPIWVSASGSICCGSTRRALAILVCKAPRLSWGSRSPATSQGHNSQRRASCCSRARSSS